MADTKKFSIFIPSGMLTQQSKANNYHPIIDIITRTNRIVIPAKGGTPLSMKTLPNLLIVDDSEENLILLETLMKNVPANLIQALSGPEALERTRGMELALAIIDVRMPGMNGYELAMKMNEERKGVKVPIVFITASHVSEGQVFEGYGSGAFDYIFKPINNRILLCKINVFLDLFIQKQTIASDAAQLKKSANELARVNAALRKSEKKYRSYINHAPDGVFVADETGHFFEVNEAACLITGYSEEELLKMSIRDLLAEESLEEGMDQFRQVVESGSSRSDLLFNDITGNKRWWALQTVKLAATRFLCFAKDITQRKTAENELKNSLEQQLQLTQHIEKVRENERVSISRELHDDLGQALTAVKIDLGIIRQQVTNSEEVVVKINKVSGLVSETIKTVQRLTSQLRPEIIDDLGLEAAIEWYTKEFAQRIGVEVLLDMDSGIAITPEASLIIFRIMQESLTNIARHARASKVYIELNKTAGFINFMISDNGIGITESDIRSNKSFGLISMKERAASLGGTFEIHRENGHGTVILLTLPLNIQTYENSDL